MEKKLHVLIVEDLPSDAELAERELKTVLKSYAVQVVDTEEGFEQALETFKPDLIISDYQMPVFNGLSALKIRQEKSPFTPFIMLTGSTNEDIAVECMKAGADDYVIKQHIKRLGLAVLSALEKKKIELEGKQSEKALRESEEKYRTLIEQSNDAVYLLYQGRFELINKKFEELFGITQEEARAPGFDSLSIVAPSSRALVEERRKMMARGEEPEHQYEFTALIKDGGEIEMDASVSYVSYRRGIATQGILRDITERKKAEEEHERLILAIEQSTETIVITDKEGTIQYVNPAFEQITGYTREEAIGRNPRFLKSGEHDDAFYKELWDTLLRGETWSGRFVNRKKDETLYTEEATISPVHDASGRTVNYVAVKRDITKEQKLERQVRQAQKMESVGRLAGGVAHDFNNMLTIIMGYAQLALENLDPADKLYKDIREINEAGQRSADLTRQLLAFSRQQAIAPRALDLNDAITNMLKMLHRLIGEDIHLVWIPGAKLGTIYLDPTQVDQVLANLCVNARDAINDTGQITIKTENVTFDESYCQTHAYATQGAYIMLTVRDDGCGMDEDTLAQIFEPFFSTKPQGEGTGLGLATVYGIVKQNEGFIEGYSEPGKGTSFKISFPRYEGVDLAVKAEKEKELPATHGELIMVVEDEPAILEMMQSMLESIGYVVIAANTPQEALRLAREQGGKIKLVMTDVVMPDMNGKELANQIHASFPEMKILFMSGYTSNVIVQRGVLDESVNFINKPFSLSQLAEKLHEVLLSTSS